MTILAQAVLEGEAPALARRAIDVAMGGDVGMLKALLPYIFVVRREQPIKIDMPTMEFADDAVNAIGAIMRDVAEGKINPSEGTALATLVKIFGDAIDRADLATRVDVLEAEIKGQRR